MVREEKRALQLPKQQLLILAICRFAEPVAMTSVYPYIPEMIQSFNVPADKVARWAGLMSATFSLSQCATGIAWGRASDRFGRKPIILLALTCTMISSILFGFSKDLTWAFITRSFQGLSNGNVGIIRTAVAELVPQKELQPLAFSIMPLVWNVGSIFGPSFGGSLVHPAERYPGLFGKFKLLKEYPFALPNLLISILFLCGISAGFLFLHETLEDKKSRRDYGLLLGKLITAPCTRKKRHVRAFSTDESDPFLPGAASEMSSPVATSATKPAQKPSGWSEVFSRQSNINLVVYTFLAMHSVAYDQLLPIFMHYPVQSIRDPNVHLPLKFAGGFGIDSNRIGLLFTVYGIFGMLVHAASLKILGTLNGVATSISAVGRAAGPALAGNTFTAGVDLGYVVVSWWTLAMVAVIGAVPIWSLVEMEGFSANQDGDDEDDEDDEEDELEEDEDNDAKTSAIPSAQAHSRHPSGSVVSEDPFVDDESLPDSGPLTRSTTRDSHTPARRHSLNLHRIASPIGLGPGVIPHGARRYSSDLGATRSGLGAGGTSYY
ncbi:MFS general substrate transporter, partial [Aureobasidium melanogenum]